MRGRGQYRGGFGFVDESGKSSQALRKQRGTEASIVRFDDRRRFYIARPFHEEPSRETAISVAMRDAGFDAGLLLGVLIGEGHFGGDRRQPHVTLKMHVRHLPLLEWLRDRVPGARLYGPYAYERRNFYQLMIRGSALRERVIPLLDALPWKEIDTHTYERYQTMKRRYGIDSPHDMAYASVDDARIDPADAPGSDGDRGR